MVDALDARIDASVERHPLPQEFVVPGGNAARGGARRGPDRVSSGRAARGGDAIAELLPDDAPLRYLNRCSDYLYVLAREVEGEHLPSRER
jgi:cob(I)alamin adenosyltransferase